MTTPTVMTMAATLASEIVVTDRASSLKKAARGAALLGIAALAGLTVSSGLAMASRGAEAELVAKLAPYNAFAQTALARDLVQVDAAQAEVAARKALWLDPTRASAAGTLGLALVQRGEVNRGMSFLDYSERISRRDLQVQLWGIELAAERGDIAAALHHYDIALRIGPDAPDLLFPTLANAISDPLVRTALAKLLVSEVPWKFSFFSYLAPRTPDIVSAARLADAIYLGGGQVPILQANVLIQRLIEAGNVDLAWTTYAHAHPRVSRLGLRNGTFELEAEYPSVLDWTLENLGQSWAEIVPGGEGNELGLFAQAGTGGTVARQTLLLAPGPHRISFKAKQTEGNSLGDSTVRISCPPSGSALVEARLLPARETRGETFSVPSNCRSQLLEVVLYSGASDGAVSGTIDDIAIEPLAAPR